MSAVSMEWVVLNVASPNSTLILPDNLKDFGHPGREEAGLIIKPIATSNYTAVQGIKVKFTLIDINQVWRLRKCPHPVIPALEPGDVITNILLNINDNSTGYFLDSWEVRI
jgi:hypothetical protein